MKKQRDRYVVHQSDGWTVRTKGSKRSSGIYDTQREAISAAKEFVANTGGGEVHIQGRNGRIRASTTVRSMDGRHFAIGAHSFEHIAAVEGMRMTKAMKRKLQILAESNLSGDDQRARIAEAYGTGRSSKRNGA